MSEPQSRPRLSWKDQDAIVRLWHELAEFPASSPQEAMGHCLRGLARIVGAVNCVWVGAVREKNWQRSAPADPLLGWRPRLSIALYPTDAWRRAYEAGVAAVRKNHCDPHTIALVGRFGQNRCHLREELVGDCEWKPHWIYRDVMTPLGIGDRLVCISAAAPRAESYLVFDRESRTRPFGRRERDLLRFFLRGSALLHREQLQCHGLLDSCEPLRARESEVLRLLLTGASEREIAGAMGISSGTAHQYVVIVLRRFGAHSRTELMAQWLRRLAPSALPNPTNQ